MQDLLLPHPLHRLPPANIYRHRVAFPCASILTVPCCIPTPCTRGCCSSCAGGRCKLWGCSSGSAAGKAAFKQQVTEAATLDPATLPLNEELVAYLQAQKTAGRELALYSAADAGVVNSVAGHLALFDHARGSDGIVNLAGAAKLAAIKERYGDNFAYAGNAAVDLPIWQAGPGGRRGHRRRASRRARLPTPPRWRRGSSRRVAARELG